MTFKTKTTAAASLIALMAATTAGAQSLGVDTGVDVDSEIGADVGDAAASTLGVDTELGADASVGEGGVDAGIDTGLTAQADVDSDVEGAVDGAVAQAEDASEGEANVVLASDSSVIGTVDTTQEDSSGRVIYTVALDPSLGLDTEVVSFMTDAEANASGELTLDMTGEEFAAAVQTQAEAMGNAMGDAETGEAETMAN